MKAYHATGWSGKLWWPYSLASCMVLVIATVAVHCTVGGDTTTAGDESSKMRDRFREMTLDELQEWATENDRKLQENPSDLNLSTLLLEAWFHLSCAHEGRGDSDKQRACYERILEIVHSMREHGLAEEYKTTAIASMAHRRLGNLDAAIKETVKDFDWELRHNQEYAIPYTLQSLAELYREKGDLESSLRALQEALARQHSVTDTALYYDLGRTHEALGDLDRALQWYEKAILLWPPEHALSFSVDRFSKEARDAMPPELKMSAEAQELGHMRQLREYEDAHEECFRKKMGQRLKSWPEWLERQR